MSIKSYGTGDLYHRYRPRKFYEIIGSTGIASSVRKAVQEGNTSAYMFVGPSGTGKTTTARIVAIAANCTLNGTEPCLYCESCISIAEGSCPDVLEMNAADSRGIDDIRALCANMAYAPMNVKKRVYIIDEAHQLTKDAQNTLLKYLEDAPKHTVIVLCSTDPKKILKTVINRCQRYAFKALRSSEMTDMLTSVVMQECEKVSSDIIKVIVDSAEGSPRKGLVLLQQCLQLDDMTTESVNGLLDYTEDSPNVIKLAFTLNAKEPKWSKIVPLYEEVKSLGASAIGMTLAGYFRNQTLKAKNMKDAIKFAKCLDVFLVPFDAGKMGENQLVAALMKAFLIKKSTK